MQTRAGAKKAVQTTRAKNPNHWKEAGRKGGSKRKRSPSGFAASGLASLAAAVGGLKRTKPANMTPERLKRLEEASEALRKALEARGEKQS